MHARVSDLAESSPPILPSANVNCVGTLISEHFAAQWLACMCLCQRFTCSLAMPAHDSRSGWFATPYLCDSYIRDSTPVYPGALTFCSQVLTLFPRLPLHFRDSRPFENACDFSGTRRAQLQRPALGESNFRGANSEYARLASVAAGLF